MEKIQIRKIQHLTIVFVAVCFSFCSISITQAATFCVQTSSALQSALNTAASNGEADEIQIVQGTYTGNFTCDTQGAYKLTVKGGYASGCATRVVNASNTVLDGSSAGTTLMISSGGNAAFECDGVTFRNGSAKRGGGLRIVSETGNITLSNNRVSGNRATEFGGGIAISSNATITLTRNTIINNESDYYAGGVSIGSGDDKGILVLDANTIAGNTSDGAVGGLMTWCNSVSITNNLFYNNSASWYHGALLVDGSNSTKIINNTITANTAEGRGAGLTIQLDDDLDRADIYNNIIYNNTGYWEANDLAIFIDQDKSGAGSPVSLLNNDFDQRSAGTYIEIPFTIDPSNLNNQDPLFVSASTGDYRLSKGSLCIDAGTSTDAPVTDIAGISRPQGKAYDMGAYEYVGIPIPDIKANGQDGAITVSSGTPVSITVGLNPDNLSGQNADWWVVESVSDGVYYHFDLGSGAMVQGLLPTYQGPLLSLGSSSLLNSSALTVGAHAFYFAVDMNMNGSLNFDQLYFDAVVVNITQ